MDLDEKKRLNMITSSIVEGDRKTAAKEYAWFVKRYSREVIDFISRMTNNRADAEELSQNAFVKAFNNLQTFENRASFLTWISRIAYNETLNHLRKQKHNFVNIDDTQIVDIEISDEDFSTGNEERIQQLEQALELLPPDNKMLVHLYYYDDKPLKEIAFIMDLDANSLGVRLHRIRKKLLEMIKNGKKSAKFMIFY